MANAVYKAFKPPVLSKASPFTGGCKVPSTSSQPEDGGSEPEKSEPERSEPETSAPSTSKTSQTGPGASHRGFGYRLRQDR